MHTCGVHDGMKVEYAIEEKGGEGRRRERGCQTVGDRSAFIKVKLALRALLLRSAQATTVPAGLHAARRKPNLQIMTRRPVGCNPRNGPIANERQARVDCAKVHSRIALALIR